jgi:hypothetical protein
MSAKWIVSGVLLVIVACSAPATEETGTSGTSWNFDATDPGALPDGLTAPVGEWKVAEDSTAPSGDRVLAQVAKNPSPVFNVALLDDSCHRDLDLSVSFLSIAGEIDQGGGLLWRARDASNYYIARYNPLENNYRLYTVVEGERQQLQSVDIAATPGWHTLRITMTGDLIRCFFDGELSLELHDGTFAEAGRIGLWTKADAQTRFDDLSIR